MPALREEDFNLGPWWTGLFYSLPVTAIVLGLFYYWFAVADRYIVFLYYHDMGPLVPDTSPFSFITSSRYWTAGLVASGAVMVLHTAATWLLGRVAARYRPPAWWRVWALSLIPLCLCIPWITMTVNQPTLPALHAARATLATMVGLALALQPGRLAAQRPGELLLLAFDGCGLMFVLLSLVGLEHLGRWLASGGTLWVERMAAGVVVGVLCLLLVTVLRTWQRTTIPGPGGVLTAGLCAAYLFMPLVHHLFVTDGYYYITCSTNFFARNRAVQAVAWSAGGLLALATTRLRRWLVVRGAKRTTLVA